MRTLRLTASFIMIFLFIYAVSGCGKKDDMQNDKKQSTDTSHKDHSSDTKQNGNIVSDGKYFCSMHPTQQSNNPDEKCPVCKMKMVSKAEYNKKMSDEHESMEQKNAGKKDLIHFEVKLSVIKSDECRSIIEAALSKDKGIAEYHLDIVNRIIHMYVDKSKTTKSNVEKLISEAGFEANDTKANTDAVSKLPDGCK